MATLIRIAWPDDELSADAPSCASNSGCVLRHFLHVSQVITKLLFHLMPAQGILQKVTHICCHYLQGSKGLQMHQRMPLLGRGLAKVGNTIPPIRPIQYGQEHVYL